VIIASATALLERLQADPDADDATLEQSTDTALSIGRDVWRLCWRGQIATAVAEDANLHTTCGALLDAFALLESDSAKSSGFLADPELDRSVVNVLVDRSLPDVNPTEADQALRSLRDSAGGVAKIWYRRVEHSWVEDRADAPTWDSDSKVEGWVNKLLLPRLAAQPGQFALDLLAAVDDPSMHLYPSSISSSSPMTFAIRLDGLQIGTLTPNSARLTVGKVGKSGDGPQRTAFIKVFGQSEVTVTSEGAPSSGELSIAEAALRVRELLRRFRSVDVRGAPISHRTSGGVPIIDEHAVEARLLKGLIHLDGAVNELVLDDDRVARGSQFPTLWGTGTNPRYLDAMLRRGTTPIAVELKVSTGGQGRYYRRSLIQAVLYRHFIRNSPGLDPWFTAASLDRMATEACIAIPVPAHWTPRFSRDLDLLRTVASHVGVAVHLLDDRATPDWVANPGLSEPPTSDVELLSWRLAAALTNRWPKSLGRLVETHECGGFYDQIQLRPMGDRSLEWPAPRSRVSLNRPGSAWVFAPGNTPRWTWREIWNHLAHGGDADEAAIIIGAIAGLPNGETKASSPGFAQMAVAFLELAKDSTWSWRCAWTDDEVAAWADRFRAPIKHYGRSAPGGRLPTVARIWGAVNAEAAAVIVDQENLRAWVWYDGACEEVTDVPSPLDRITRAVKLIGG
jgi:hypothetical protein